MAIDTSLSSCCTQASQEIKSDQKKDLEIMFFFVKEDEIERQNESVRWFTKVFKLKKLIEMKNTEAEFLNEKALQKFEQIRKQEILP